MSRTAVSDPDSDRPWMSRCAAQPGSKDEEVCGRKVSLPVLALDSDTSKVQFPAFQSSSHTRRLPRLSPLANYSTGPRLRAKASVRRKQRFGLPGSETKTSPTQSLDLITYAASWLPGFLKALPCYLSMTHPRVTRGYHGLFIRWTFHLASGLPAPAISDFT